MVALIERLKTGKLLGSTFATKFTYGSIVTVPSPESTDECRRLPERTQNGWATSSQSHLPSANPPAGCLTTRPPYYREEAFEYGVPCQMVDTDK